MQIKRMNENYAGIHKSEVSTTAAKMNSLQIAVVAKF
jgi:hypothetical protein